MLHIAMARIEKRVYVVTRVAVGFRAGYRHVKINAENKNNVTQENITENTLQKHE